MLGQSPKPCAYTLLHLKALQHPHLFHMVTISWSKIHTTDRKTWKSDKSTFQILKLKTVLCTLHTTLFGANCHISTSALMQSWFKFHLLKIITSTEFQLQRVKHLTEICVPRRTATKLWLYKAWSFNFGTDFFSQETSYVAKWQQSGTHVNSVQVYVQNRRLVSPRIRSVEAFQWTSTCSVVCIDFCFRLGKIGAETYEMLQAAFGESCLSRSKTLERYSHFNRGRRSFEDDPQPRQAVQLPHRGEHGTCARNHSRWPRSDYQRGCRRS